MRTPPLQDYLFRLVPGYVDSGKGKCSYDPKQESIAVLISKTCHLSAERKQLFIKFVQNEKVSPLCPPAVSPLQTATSMQVSTLTS